MRFTPSEIEVAHQLKAAGLLWQPRPGHYVWDGEPLIGHDSPFHDRVFFILDLKHFLRRSETMERLVASMVWLPTWHQCRDLLHDQGVTGQQVAERLQQTDALENRTERLELYRMLLESWG